MVNSFWSTPFDHHQSFPHLLNRNIADLPTHHSQRPHAGFLYYLWRYVQTFIVLVLFIFIQNLILNCIHARILSLFHIPLPFQNINTVLYTFFFFFLISQYKCKIGHNMYMQINYILLYIQIWKEMIVITITF